MKAFWVAAACGMVLALAGCSGDFKGTARGLFVGYVTDKTEEEVVAKVGPTGALVFITVYLT